METPTTKSGHENAKVSTGRLLGDITGALSMHITSWHNLRNKSLRSQTPALRLK